VGGGLGGAVGGGAEVEWLVGARSRLRASLVGAGLVGACGARSWRGQDHYARHVSSVEGRVALVGDVLGR
jgi:hypothetical protein